MIPWLNTHTLAYLAWGLVNAGLIAQLGQQTQWGVQPGLPVPLVAEQTPGKMVVETMPDYRLPALKKHFNETLTRPLFVPSRREAPPIPPPPPPPKPTMKRGQYQLVGTILVDQDKIAILKEVAGGKLRQVTEGGTIDGVMLNKVGPDRVELTQYDEFEELRLKIQPSPKVGSVPELVKGVPGRVSLPQARGDPVIPIENPAVGAQAAPNRSIIRYKSSRQNASEVE